MRLKLSDLQQVVKETLQEKKHSDAFCDEIKKVFGPSVIVGNTLGSLVEAANEHLDVLEYKGHLDTVHFSDKVALGMVNHESADVRKFVARILPESVASSLLLDRNASVRIAAAKKSSAKMIKEKKGDKKNSKIRKNVRSPEWQSMDGYPLNVCFQG